ncbi:MAG: TlpA family protein disulfide reductase [Flavobacteriales bacterium]
MKKLFLSVLLLACTLVMAQQKLPSVSIKTLDKEVIDASELSNDGKPMVISFWATWCKPCQRELDAINEVYEDWVDETGVKVYAISIDDSRNVSRVAPLVNGKAWEFDVLLDTNSDLKRALGVGTIPHTFLLNGKGEIVYQHTGYNDGDEEELLEHIQELLK